MKIALRYMAGTLVAAIAFTISPAAAATIPVTNPSFEAQALADNQAVLGVVGWTITNNMTGTYNPNAAAFPGGASDGLNTAFINNVSPDSIRQVLTTTLQPNSLYTLLVDVGARADFPMGPFQVQLVAGGVVKGSESTPVPAAGTFSTVTISFEPTDDDPQLGLPLEIRLIATMSTASQVNFDNVRLSVGELNATPTVSQLGLVGLLAGLALVGMRKVRRSRLSRS